MKVETEATYWKSYREPVDQPDPNRVPSYIKPETVEIGSRRIVGGKTRIDINI